MGRQRLGEAVMGSSFSWRPEGVQVRVGRSREGGRVKAEAETQGGGDS